MSDPTPAARRKLLAFADILEAKAADNEERTGMTLIAVARELRWCAAEIREALAVPVPTEDGPTDDRAGCECSWHNGRHAYCYASCKGGCGCAGGPVPTEDGPVLTEHGCSRCMSGTGCSGTMCSLTEDGPTSEKPKRQLVREFLALLPTEQAKLYKEFMPKGTMFWFDPDRIFRLFEFIGEHDLRDEFAAALSARLPVAPDEAPNGD